MQKNKALKISGVVLIAALIIFLFSIEWIKPSDLVKNTVDYGTIVKGHTNIDADGEVNGGIHKHDRKEEMKSKGENKGKNGRKEKGDEKDMKNEEGIDETETEGSESEEISQRKRQKEKSQLKSQEEYESDEPSEKDRKFGYCQRRRFGYALPNTALITIPGSGNTWARYLIEQTTGIYSGSVPCDGYLKRGGFFGECNRKLGAVIVTKTHGLKKFVQLYQRAVVVIRNPLKTLSAELQRRRTLSHVAIGKVPQEEVQGEKIRNSLNRWIRFHTDLLQFKGPLLVLIFDNLILHLKDELLRMCEFFSVPCSEHLINCILKHNEGNFHRHKHNESNLFTAEDLRNSSLLVSQMSDLVKNRFPTYKFDQIIL